MTTFIRVAEIWVPDADGYLLEFGGGLYANAPEFGAVSRSMCFGRGEGLPGRVWEEKAPIVLDDLQGGYFQRAAAAKAAGLTSAVAFPVHFGELLKAVVVLFCAAMDARPVAVRLMSGSPGDAALVLPCPTPGADGSALVFEAERVTPIARRIERWLPRSDTMSLMLAGACGDQPLADPAIEAAFASGMPTVAPASGLLALPVVKQGAVGEALALYL